MACYYAHEEGVKSWVAEIDYPGNHVVCVLSDKKPTWENLLVMQSSEETDVWIVDVWSKVSATPGCYFCDFRAQLVSWASQNKRIGWKFGAGNQEFAWVEANNQEMVAKLLKSNITYQPGGNL